MPQRFNVEAFLRCVTIFTLCGPVLGAFVFHHIMPIPPWMVPEYFIFLVFLLGGAYWLSTASAFVAGVLFAILFGRRMPWLRRLVPGGAFGLGVLCGAFGVLLAHDLPGGLPDKVFPFLLLIGAIAGGICGVIVANGWPAPQPPEGA